MVDLGQIDRGNGVPPYEQIAQLLRAAITSRVLAPGERLPTETKLAEHFGVARMTVRRAVQELRGQGMLVPASGRGFAVRPAPAIRELWPHEPGDPTEVAVPDFNTWGDAAPLIAQAENIRTRMYVLSGDLREVGLSAGDPAVADKLVRTLAGIGLAESDVLGALAIRLNVYAADSEHANEIFSAMRAAQQAFAEACGVAQSAAESLHGYLSKKDDTQSVERDSLPRRVYD